VVMKAITAADVASILYEEFVNRLENEDAEEFTESELDGIVDSILSLTESLPGRSEAYGNNNEHT
jgi:hypothetical protein